jgi:hypothetical protein
MDIFDALAGSMLANEGIAKADANVDKAWALVALKAVSWLAMTQEEFTADDVWGILATDPAFTHEPRALGGVMRRAVSCGYIESTDRYILSSRPECHRNPKRVWKSLLQDAELPKPALD